MICLCVSCTVECACGTQVLTAEVSQGIIDSCNFGLTSDNTEESFLFSLTELRNTLIGIYMSSLINNIYMICVSNVS